MAQRNCNRFYQVLPNTFTPIGKWVLKSAHKIPPTTFNFQPPSSIGHFSSNWLELHTMTLVPKDSLLKTNS